MRSGRSCAGLLQPIAAFVIGALMAALDPGDEAIAGVMLLCAGCYDAREQIGDDCIAALSSLPHMETINIVGTRVTARSEPVLRAMSSLRTLHAWDTEMGEILLTEDPR